MSGLALWKPSDKDWSQHEVLTHIWIGDHFVFLPRLRAIAEQDRPPLPLVDEVALQQAEWRADRSRDDSDVDLLVTLAPGTSALALGGLLLNAQELLGRRVDVVTEASLHSALRERVLADAVPL